MKVTTTTTMMVTLMKINRCSCSSNGCNAESLWKQCRHPADHWLEDNVHLIVVILVVVAIVVTNTVVIVDAVGIVNCG